VEEAVRVRLSDFAFSHIFTIFALIKCEYMRKDLRGLKFGKLIVEEINSKTRNGHIRYRCLCECGNKTDVLGTHLIQGNTKSCGCDRPVGKSHPKWTGIGDISGNFWRHSIERSANGDKGSRAPVELSISKEYIWDLFLKQNKKCALSGIELHFPTRSKDRSGTASLDRIDSSLGYVDGNVQWVHKDINRMKNVFNNDYFIKICTMISENNKHESCLVEMDVK